MTNKKSRANTKDENFLDLTEKNKKSNATAQKQISNKFQKLKDIRLPAGRNSKLAIIVLAVVLIVAGALLFIFKGSDMTSLTNQQVVERVEDLVADLPSDESPQVATVEDAQALTAQDGFYSLAQDGDKVLVYVIGNRALIYRPSTNEIVKDGAVSALDR